MKTANFLRMNTQGNLRSLLRWLRDKIWPGTNRPRVICFVPCLSLMLALAASPGCGRGGDEPELLAIEQVPSTVEDAFKDAPTELKDSASEVVTAIQGKDESKALLDLQALFARPDLNPEQREAASRSMISLNQKLRAAAEKGDQRAAEALQTYRARK